MTNLDNLRTLDPASLQAVFPELVGEEKDAGRQWVGDRRHVREAISG